MFHIESSFPKRKLSILCLRLYYTTFVKKVNGIKAI